MKYLIALILILALTATAYAGTAYYTGQRVDGMYTICYYNYLGSTVAKTIKTGQMCPMTIEVD